MIKALTSDETGSYYGATLLVVDVDNDGVDELFVGAPFGSGNSFDEGYVYYYGNVSESMIFSFLYFRLTCGLKFGILDIFKYTGSE